MYKILIAFLCLFCLPLFGENLSIATFAGGCFWCMQPIYDNQEGVVKTVVGYTGGEEENPTYEEVSSGNTGHAEAVEVYYNPDQVSYDKLLEIFWKNIDPTVKDKQFCDTGKQYRSAIFTHNEQQYQKALASKKRLLDHFDHIYTEITPAGPFYPAEEYHQNYYLKNPFRYKVYRYLCGRDKRLKTLWDKAS